MAKKGKYLSERNGRWYVRIPIPLELQDHFGRTQFWTHVADTRVEAERKSHAVIAVHIDQIESARRKNEVPLPSPDQYLPALYDRTFARLLLERGNQDDLWEDGKLSEDWSSKSGKNIHEMTWKLRGKLLEKIETNRAPQDEAEAVIGWMIDDLIARKELPAGLSPNQRATVSRFAASIERLARQQAEDRHVAGTVFVRPSHPLFEKPAARVATLKGPTLNDVLPKMHKQKQPAPNTIKEHQVAVRMFNEFMGIEVPISAVKASDIRGFRDALLELPTNAKQRFPGKTVPEAISANRKRSAPYETLDTSTVKKKWLSHIRNLFGFATDEGIIDDNPAQNVKVNRGKSFKKPGRVNFTPKELDAIFHTALFDNPSEWGEKQWALLLTAYTGSRSSSEVSRLHADDFYDVDGLPVIHFSRGSKNEGADHLVPMHHRLVTLGLPKFVEAAKKNPSQRLFPYWYDSDKINRWFLRTYKRKVGISDSRKVFHSFRHTLKTELVNAATPQNIVDRIIPHANHSASAGYIHLEATSLMAEMARYLNAIQLERIGESDSN